jgi:hypothetical protein
VAPVIGFGSSFHQGAPAIVCLRWSNFLMIKPKVALMIMPQVKSPIVTILLLKVMELASCQMAGLVQCSTLCRDNGHKCEWYVGNDLRARCSPW